MIIQIFTQAQVILALKPSAVNPAASAILWKDDAPERLHRELQPLLENIIRATMKDANVLEEMIMMMGVGKDLKHDAGTIMSRAVGAAMLLAFGIHPTYGDAYNLAINHQGDVLTEEQRRTMADLQDRGYTAKPLVRYGRMTKNGHQVTIAPDGTFATSPTE